MSPVSNFFNNYMNSQEQELVEDLAIEMIRIHGIDVYYMPRDLGDVDPVYGEAASSSYNSAYLIEMYIEDVMGFGGEGDLLSKFGGLTIRDSVTLTVARRVFSAEVGDFSDQVRPFEGDLIYLPLNKKLFRIQFVEHESVFYQMGSLQVWQLKCELMEYSGEDFNTGIPEIDDLVSGYDPSIDGHGLVTEDDESIFLAYEEDGLPILFEEYVNTEDDNLLEENDYYQQRGLEIIDFTEIDPFSEGENY